MDLQSCRVRGIVTMRGGEDFAPAPACAYARSGVASAHGDVAYAGSGRVIAAASRSIQSFIHCVDL